MKYECPHCGVELERVDSYFKNGEILGDIFKCPNAEGFSSLAEAMMCDPEKTTPENWEEACCYSNTNSVCGSFYTDRSGTLYEGYPC